MSAAHQDFEVAVAKGSGRAMLILRRSPDDAVLGAALLDACVRNLTYDRQCEDGRGSYLARLITATGRQAWFFDVLTRRLEERVTEEEDFHLLQAFSVLVQLAAEHAELDRSAVRRLFEVLPVDDQLDCMEDFVGLEGLSALLDCAILLAAQSDTEAWRSSSLLNTIRDRDGLKIDETLAGLRQNHPPLERLMAQAEADSATLLPSDEPYDFASIRSSLREGTRPSGAWFRKLSDDEWRQLAEDMTECKNGQTVLPYLRLYARRPFPLALSHLLSWIDNSNPRVVWAATNALGRVRAPIVREMALKRARAGDASGVRLLAASYEPGDFGLIEPMLDADLDVDDAHDLGLAVLNLMEEHDNLQEAVPSLLRLYEQTPCSLCRGSAVSHLARLDSLPAWIVEECRFDADRETAERFQTT